MWGPATAKPSKSGSISGALLAGLLVLIVALLYLGFYLTLPDYHHFYALIVIGIVSIVASVVAYFSQAFSRDPSAQRAASWGFGVFGLAVLFLTVGAFPYLYPNGGSPLSGLAWLGAIIVLLIFLAVAIAVTRWRVMGHAVDTRREESRAAWEHRPAPSAFSYSTAQMPTDSAPAEPTNRSTPPMRGN